MFYDELGAALLEAKRLERQARTARRALRNLQDVRRLGEYRLEGGGPLDEREVLDFLHLAIGSTREDVQITVTAHRAQTEGEPQ